MNDFSAGECIRFGWETFKKRPWFLIGAYLLLILVVGIATGVLGRFNADGTAISLIAALARFVLDLLAGMGTIAFTLKAHDDIEHVSIVDFWHPYPFWKYTGSTLLFGIILVGGFLLLVVPGIIWSIMFGFAGYLVVDKAMWPMEALKESKRMTYGYKWELFLLAIFTILIVLLGVVCLLVGMLVAYPIVTIATAHAFRTIESHSTNSSGERAIA